MQLLVRKAISYYFTDIHALQIEEELNKGSWNKDLHYKIMINGKRYSARFLGVNRTENPAFGHITNKQLEEQIRFSRYLREHDIPFMRIMQSSTNHPFVFFTWNDEVYRFVLSEWIEGIHITYCDENIAEEFGREARRFHDISSRFQSSTFSKKSHLHGYKEFIKLLRNEVPARIVLSESTSVLQNYLEVAEYHIEKAYSKDLNFIMQSDLNPLNIIWDSNQKIKGIVDFESIGYGDRIEGLAWLIKWYSRTKGISSHEVCPKVAQAFLKGYDSGDFLDSTDNERLSSLLWLSGCLNWNFVKKTLESLEENCERLLEEHLEFYKLRGEKLYSLLKVD
ncbi:MULTISPECIES: phosphotransferase enzyme family protein [Bacillus]|uniref:phosphotransferase enzyme family protein n=1 Tax=Bacillus TaxID=1386 RepID=UPI0003073AC0|nr:MULTISPECIES: aminoglycoside phosphotransferase family protein [Bacillus]MBO1580406.1 aminoglycoside phosphotransferase family protein [Bacillus sp. XF8]